MDKLKFELDKQAYQRNYLYNYIPVTTSRGIKYNGINLLLFSDCYPELTYINDINIDNLNQTDLEFIFNANYYNISFAHKYLNFIVNISEKHDISNYAFNIISVFDKFVKTLYCLSHVSTVIDKVKQEKYKSFITDFINIIYNLFTKLNISSSNIKKILTITLPYRHKYWIKRKKDLKSYVIYHSLISLYLDHVTATQFIYLLYQERSVNSINLILQLIPKLNKKLLKRKIYVSLNYKEDYDIIKCLIQHDILPSMHDLEYCNWSLYFKNYSPEDLNLNLNQLKMFGTQLLNIYTNVLIHNNILNDTVVNNFIEYSIHSKHFYRDEIMNENKNDNNVRNYMHTNISEILELFIKSGYNLTLDHIEKCIDSNIPVSNFSQSNLDYDIILDYCHENHYYLMCPEFLRIDKFYKYYKDTKDKYESDLKYNYLKKELDQMDIILNNTQ